MEQSGTGSPESGNTFEGENTIKHPAVCDLYQSSLISDQLLVCNPNFNCETQVFVPNHPLSYKID